MTGSRTSRTARAAAATALALASVGLGGCSTMSAIGQHVPYFGHSRAHAIARTLSKLDEARERGSLAPNEPYWPYREAQLDLDADSLEAARAALEASLARDSSYLPALSLLSKLDYESGRNADAVRRIEAARSRFPDGLPPALQTALALHYDALDRPDLARATLPGAPAGDLGDGGSARVFLILRGDHPDSATALAASAVHDDPRSAVNQNNYGITRLRASDPAGARKAFLKAIDLDSHLAGPYYNLAILEKYYLLDDQAAAKWFDLYWDRSHADPDGLAGIFGKGASKPLAGGKD
jgi:predicted Zn-dependent protease